MEMAGHPVSRPSAPTAEPSWAARRTGALICYVLGPVTGSYVESAVRTLVITGDNERVPRAGPRPMRTQARPLASFHHSRPACHASSMPVCTVTDKEEAVRGNTGRLRRDHEHVGLDWSRRMGNLLWSMNSTAIHHPHRTNPALPLSLRYLANVTRTDWLA
ncbi:hypothetical protein B0T22DRAFT_6858 [Podospora appendiculata]|uniref:Uncharacterized protein n=1 Tax=Podospora appendiculata TaxID=314037 RepID=A0AAE1CFD7_9PEZI|nr:hypothetical protein B0T22DRAFT_6858 [Podospora appendiculata]